MKKFTPFLSDTSVCSGKMETHLGVLSLLAQALQKGNLEGARIHAENAIRQKNQVGTRIGVGSVDKMVRVDPLFVCAGSELYENECSCGWGRLSCAVGYPDETGEMSNWIFP